VNDPQSLADLQAKIREFVDERDWDQFHNPKDLAISLVLEATEVLEHFQWKDDNAMATHVKENRQEVAEELSDTFYCVLLLANKLDIDLVEVFEQKMAKNRKKYPIKKAKGTAKKYTSL
jgi:dCTP diphosphatase